MSIGGKKGRSRADVRRDTMLDCSGDPGRTKQAFRDETNINNIVAGFQRSGTVSHLAKYEPRYADITPMDFQSAMETVAEANRMFEELPSEVRREFDQDPAKFLAFVQDPSNKDDLAEKLPLLAKPGDQFPAVDAATMAAAVAAGTAAAEAALAAGDVDASSEPPEGDPPGGDTEGAAAPA